MIALSIVIPLFNKARYVRGALVDLAAQLLEGDEIIVVDDCSTDDSAKIVDSLRLPGVKLLQSPFNDGPASARNLGAAAARGTHLLFFDADDVPQPDLMAALREAIAAHPMEAVWAYRLAFQAHGETALTDDGVAQPTIATTVLPQDSFVEFSLAGKPLCTASSTCVRIDAFRASGGFQQGLRYCEDPELWARLSARYSIVLIDRTLATYRDVPASLSYGLRAKPGSVQPYVDTLLQLAGSRGDAYRRLASSMIVRNSVFSTALGGSRRELLSYLRHLRNVHMLRTSSAIALSTLALLPRALVRAPLSLRSALSRRRAYGRASAAGSEAPAIASGPTSPPARPPAKRPPRAVSGPSAGSPASDSSAVFYFLLLGCLQTLIAYFAFQRADDHAYFLDVANRGVAAVEVYGNPLVDLKSQIGAWIYYVLATPSRWLGGGELTHLLWLRLLTLLGFVWAHRWICRVIAPGAHQRLVNQSQKTFLVLCLLYPAQLAWTASLLRDGVSCAMLFGALLAWSKRRWLLASVCLVASLGLRPEFALLLALLAVVVPRWRMIGRMRHRMLLLLAVCLGISIAAFDIRANASAFAIAAFGEEGAAYPSIQGVSDIRGYALVLLQSALDPMSIGSPGAGGIFAWAEAAFFAFVSVGALRRLNRAPSAPLHCSSPYSP